MSFVWVFLGGGVGAVLRFTIGKLIALYFNGVFPLATLLANILSCIIFGVVAFKFPSTIQTNTKLLLLTGICGGLSTFSTFSFETFELLKTGQWPWAVVNVLLSVVLCLVVLWVVYKSI